MPDKNAFRFVDLQNRTVSSDIDMIFPGWKPGDERVVILSPHDDDGILGAGYALLASQAFGADVHVLIYSCGCLGYSLPEQKDTIVDIRRAETYEAYAAAGIPKENIHRLEFDDLSILSYVAWRTPGGAVGTVGKVIPTLREIKATRILIPNHNKENVDHEAVYKSGVYEGPQVGDAIIAESPVSEPVRSALQFSVWADFDPEEALVEGRDMSVRANRLILCEKQTALGLNKGLAAWKSQAQIIKGLVESRKAREYGDWMMEAYIQFDPRPALDYTPYARFLNNVFGGQL